jgi:putative transposase
MSHTFTKIWMHVVFSTHQRDPIISSKLEVFLYRHVSNLLKEMECVPLAINGMPDHIHLLFQMNPTKSVAEVIKHVKGNSSHTINQSNLTENKFAWQTGYSAFSVSESVVEKVREYVLNQKEHHKKDSFQDEFEKFLKAYKLETSN